MACTVTSLLLIIGTVRLWPLTEKFDPDQITYREFEQERIVIDEISPTKQANEMRPPPPIPPLTVVVPNDFILESEPLDLSESFVLSPDYGSDRSYSSGSGLPGSSSNAEPVVIGPKPVRFVEPEYTRAARKNRIRAEIVVDVIIDENGIVQETKVVERFLLSDNNVPKRPVDEIGFGLEEAAVTAAEQWKFRPAERGGKPVRSSTTLTFRFGV